MNLGSGCGIGFFIYNMCIDYFLGWGLVVVVDWGGVLVEYEKLFVIGFFNRWFWFVGVKSDFDLGLWLVGSVVVLIWVFDVGIGYMYGYI